MTYIIKQKHQLTLDYEGILLRGYEGNVGGHALYKKWYSEIIKKSCTYYCSHHVARKIVTRLKKKGLHEDEDHLIIGLAINSDKYIVTEDSDFGIGCDVCAQEHSDVLEYLNVIGVKVHNATDACNYLSTN